MMIRKRDLGLWGRSHPPEGDRDPAPDTTGGGEVEQQPVSSQPSKETKSDPSFAQFDEDFSGVISSLQSRVHQMRQAAQQEIGRLRAQHEAERQRLTAEIETLKTRCAGQDHQIRQLHEQSRTLLADYSMDLRLQVEKADSARGRLERVQELLAQMEKQPAPAPVPVPSDMEPTPQHPFRIAAVTPSAPQPQQQEGENTVAMGPRDEAPMPTTPPAGEPTRISISGVSSVSAMMRARKAVEGLPGIQDVESRYVSDGTLHFSVRTEEDAEALARSLTELRDPKFRNRKVSGKTIELEM